MRRRLLTARDRSGFPITGGRSCTRRRARSLHREKKTDISYALERYDALFEKLRPASYRLKSGTSGRTHTGLVAQDVEQALRECGLTGKDFAAFVKTPREDGGADYGLRYEELIALCIRQVQMLREKVRKLEETA